MAQPVIPAPVNAEKIRVLAADSTRMSSQLLAESLAQDQLFDVIGIEPRSAAILEAVNHTRPHVVLISSTLEDSATLGFDLTRRVRALHPQTRVILLMNSSSPAAVVEAFRSGAQGIFSRTESSKALARCIGSVYQGQVWANSTELGYLLDALRDSEPLRVIDSRGDAILSRREQEVVRCVAEGLSNREIASRLKLTEHTVKNYLFRIFDKLGVSSRVEVVLYVFGTRKQMEEPSNGNGRHMSDSVPALVSQPAKPAVKMAPGTVEPTREPLREMSRRNRI